MKPRHLGILILLTAAATALWVVLLIVRMASNPPVMSLAENVASIERQYGLFVVSYINAALITLLNWIMLDKVCQHCGRWNAGEAKISRVFLPFYGLANLTVYLSQVFVVPGFIANYTDYDQYTIHAIAEALLPLVLHEWDGSPIAFINSLAYALLGVPSVLMGMRLYRSAWQGEGGGLLALSGVLSFLAFLGVVIGSETLATLTLVSGGVYLVALIPLAVYFLKLPAEGPAEVQVQNT